MKSISRYMPVLPWAIMVMGLVIRCWQLMTLPPWYDEAFTLLVAKMPLSAMFMAISGDVHPPLYYLIISALIHLAPVQYQLLCLRLFSVVCSFGVLVLFWHISGLLQYSKAARLAGLVILTLHPVEIYYSQEGRMYTWLTLLLLLMCWALIKQNWLGLALATLATLYTHNYGMFYVALLGLAGLGHYLLQPIPVFVAGKSTVLGGPLGKFILAMGLPVLLFVPWLWVVAGQMGQLQSVGYWLPETTLGSVLMIIHRVVMGAQSLGNWSLISVPVMGAGLVLVFMATKKQIVLWLLVVGPVVLALVVGWVWGKPVLLYRGLLPSLPMLAMLAGLAWVQVGSAPGLVGRWLLVSPLVISLGCQLAYPYNFPSKTEVAWNESISKLPQLVHMEDTSYITIGAMYPDIDNYLLDAGCPEQPGGMAPTTRQAMGYKIIKPDQLPQHFYLAAVISTLSTRCHETIFHQLTDGQTPLMVGGTAFGIYGVWEIR